MIWECNKIGMAAIVTFDISQRRISKVGLLWTRLTPTRGTKILASTIAQAAAAGPLSVDIEKGSLTLTDFFGRSEHPTPAAISKQLRKAGIVKLEVERGTSAETIRRIFNILIERGTEQAESMLLNSFGIGSTSIHSGVN